MAITFHSSGVWSSTTTPDTPAITISAGDIVLGATALIPTSLAITGVTDSGPGGNTYTSQIGSATSGTLKGELWGTQLNVGNAATGASVAFSGTATDTDAAFASYSGHLGIIVGTPVTGSGANPSVSQVLTDPNNVLVVFFLWASNAGTTAGTGNLRNSDSNISTSAAIVDNTAASGSVTCSCTHTAASWIAFPVELRTVAGGAQAPVGFGGSRGVPGQGPRDRRGFLKRSIWDYTISSVAAIIGFADVGALVVTGFAPTGNIQGVADVGSLVTTGQAPSAQINTVAGLGQLTITGFAGRNAIASVPGFGQLTITGQAPVAQLSTVAGLGQIVIGGQAPRAAISTVAGLGQPIISGFAPSSSIGATGLPGTGALLISGLAPQGAISGLPGSGAILITGFAPSQFVPAVGIVGLPGTGQLVILGYAPKGSGLFFPVDASVTVFSDITEGVSAFTQISKSAITTTDLSESQSAFSDVDESNPTFTDVCE